MNRPITYLEIGVRNPDDNFNRIKAEDKYSVDPGVEFKVNPVDFKLTSDQFFAQLLNGEVLNQNILFDVIFIDGLHCRHLWRPYGVTQNTSCTNTTCVIGHPAFGCCGEKAAEACLIHVECRTDRQ